MSARCSGVWCVYLTGGVAVVNIAIMIGMVGGPLMFFHLLEQLVQPNLVYSAANLAGTTTLITGANRGLGFGISLAIAKNNGSVVMTGRRAEKCQKAVNSNEVFSRILETDPERVGFSSLDLLSFESIDNFVQTTQQNYKELDILILNAAMAGLQPKDATTGINRLIGVNFLGNIYLVQQLYQHNLITQNTRIIVVTSGAHLNGIPYKMPHKEDIDMSNASWMYGQSKFLLNTWLNGWIASLKKESKPRPYYILWNPGPVDTDLGSESVPAVLFPTYWAMRKIFFVSVDIAAETVLYLLSQPHPLKSGDYIHMRVVTQPHPWITKDESQKWVLEQADSILEELAMVSPAKQN